MDRSALFSLLIANTVALLVALAADWGWHPLLVLYWFECCVIGAYNVLKMFVVALAGNPFGRWAAFSGPLPAIVTVVFLVLFFVVKFGGFLIGSGLLVLTLPAFFDPEAGWEAARDALAAHGRTMVLAGAFLVASHGVSFVRNFLLGGEYQRKNLLLLLFFPYLRLLWLVLTCLVALAVAAWQPLLAPTAAFTVLLVGVKLLVDLFTHWLEHRRRSTPAFRDGGNPPP